MIPRRLLFLAIIASVCLGCWLALFVAERSYRDPPNYSKIEENLYLGGLRPRTAVRNASGFQFVCEIEDKFHCEIEEWLPIRDCAQAPEIDWLRQTVEWLEAQQLAGRITYVHRCAGVSRSGMVVAAYLMKKNDWTQDRAIEFIRTKRPQVDRAFTRHRNTKSPCNP